MSEILDGLGFLQTNTGCFFTGKYKKEDIPLSQFIQKSWNEKLNFTESMHATYSILVGNHQPHAITYNDYYNQYNGTVQTFKGVLDILIIPLIARRLYNWAQLHMGASNNSLAMELAISAARVFTWAIYLARIVIGSALTICLMPVVGLIYLLRQVNNPTTENPSDEEGYGSNRSPRVYGTSSR